MLTMNPSPLLGATRGAACGLALVLASVVLPGSPEPGTTAAVDNGRELYRIYCSSCHGERANGQGPEAGSLEVPPSDLTRLSRRNGGTFPAEKAHKTIDGRATIRAHKTRSMPIWGMAFQEFDRDTNQEAEVKTRIRQLVSYLESIQKK